MIVKKRNFVFALRRRELVTAGSVFISLPGAMVSQIARITLMRCSAILTVQQKNSGASFPPTAYSMTGCVTGRGTVVTGVTRRSALCSPVSRESSPASNLLRCVVMESIATPVSSVSTASGSVTGRMIAGTAVTRTPPCAGPGFASQTGSDVTTTSASSGAPFAMLTMTAQMDQTSLCMHVHCPVLVQILRSLSDVATQSALTSLLYVTVTMIAMMELTRQTVTTPPSAHSEPAPRSAR